MIRQTGQDKTRQAKTRGVTDRYNKTRKDTWEAKLIKEKMKQEKDTKRQEKT